MSETKHTPGPWVAYPCQSNGYTVFADTEAGKICVIDSQDYEGRYGTIDDEANARLIAAAPELLEALETCLVLMDYGGTWTVEEQNTARAAIAKAKGEQP